jgi:hypothetical protein
MENVMTTYGKVTLAGMLSAGLLALASSNAFAQVNCGAASSSQMRAWCYQQSARAYRQQSQQYNNIARGMYRQHQYIGRALGRAPVIGNYAGRAWNAPRYYYNYRYERPY